MYRVRNIFTGVMIEANRRAVLNRVVRWETINFPESAKGWIYRKNWKTSKTFHKYYVKTYRQLV